MSISTSCGNYNINPIHSLPHQTTMPWIMRCWRCRVSNVFCHLSKPVTSSSGCSQLPSCLSASLPVMMLFHTVALGGSSIRNKYWYASHCNPISTANMDKNAQLKYVCFGLILFIYTIHMIRITKTLLQISNIFMVCVNFGFLPVHMHIGLLPELTEYISLHFRITISVANHHDNYDYCLNAYVHSLFLPQSLAFWNKVIVDLQLTIWSKHKSSKILAICQDPGTDIQPPQVGL